MNPAVISVDTRKSQRNLWRSNGTKRRAGIITEIKVEMFNHQGALQPDGGDNTTTSNIQSLNNEEKR